MHINMKYYIVSIGAIFIALGIGMLVGFNLNYDQELSKQQATIIEDLDTKFENLKSKNDKLEQDLSSLTKDYDASINYINQNVDKLIADELSEKNIGIISTNENNDYTKNLEDTIVKANGSVSFNISIKNNINNLKKIEEASQKIGVELKDSKDLIEYIIESLKSEDASIKLSYLEELGLIKVNTLNNTYLNYDSVILAGGHDSKDGEKQFEAIDNILVNKLKEENKYVLGVQQSDAKFSYVDLYAKNKVTTIDNIDEGAGKVSLVLSIKEGITGEKFGRLEGANSLLPENK